LLQNRYNRYVQTAAARSRSPPHRNHEKHEVTRRRDALDEPLADIARSYSVSRSMISLLTA